MDEFRSNLENRGLVLGSSELTPELIFLAEDTQFTAEENIGLSHRLLNYALRHRAFHNEDEAVVWSAIRTGASMLRPEETDCLLRLLEFGFPIDTVLVTLKMIGRIFENNPTSSCRDTVLAKKVNKISFAVLNPSVLISVDGSLSNPMFMNETAMAVLSTYALGVMRSPYFPDRISDVLSSKNAIISGRLEHKLDELRSNWASKDVSGSLWIGSALAVLRP